MKQIPIVAIVKSWRTELIFSLLVSLLLIFRVEILPIIPGLESSWIYGMNVAWDQGIAWGRDFISTYGPYGFLVQTMDVGNTVELRIVFELAFAFLAGITVFFLVREAFHIKPWLSYGAIALLVYTLSIQHYAWKLFVLTILLVYLGVEKKKDVYPFVLAAVVSGLYTLIKFPLGVPAFLTTIVGIAFVGMKNVRQTLGWTLVAFIGSFLLFWSLGRQEFFSIPGFIQSQLELSKGYPGAMGLYWPTSGKSILWFLLFFVLLGLWVFSMRSKRIVGLFFLFVIPLFVAWKTAIVRQDSHVLILTTFGLLPVVLFLLSASTQRRFIMGCVLGVASIFFLTKGSVSNQIPWEQVRVVFTLPWESRLGGDIQYLLPNYLEEKRAYLVSFYAGRLAQMVLPERLRQTIGNSTIDIYPWELSFVEANNLHWTNRPVIQSYSAFTPYLDGRDAQFFRSRKQPDFILWHHEWYLGGGMGSIDARHVFFDEPQSVKQIVTSYELADAQGNLTLLKKRSLPLTIRKSIGQTMQVGWNTWVQIPKKEKDVVEVSIEFQPSFILKLWQGLFREEPVMITLKYASGEEGSYRVVPQNLVSGIWINPFVATTNDFRQFLKEKKGKEVVAIRLSGNGYDRFASPIFLSWRQVSL